MTLSLLLKIIFDIYRAIFKSFKSHGMPGVEGIISDIFFIPRLLYDSYWCLHVH